MRRQRRRIGFLAIGAAGLALLFNVGAARGQLQQAGSADDLDSQFAAAETVFSSADQPDSIALFDALIARLEGLDGATAANVKTLLLRSFSYRAQARHNLGDEAAAVADLQRMLILDATADVDRDRVSPKLAELFDTLRAETVAYLSISVGPPDATLRVDGVEVDWSMGTLAVLAGSHAISVDRMGFSSHQAEIELEAGDTFPVEATLERTTAVVSFAFTPADAEVLLDGRPVRLVPGLPDGSEPIDRDYFSVSGLNVGEHELEVQSEGNRAQSRSFTVSEMTDQDLGTIDLERAFGTIALRLLPADARVEIDGALTELQPSATGEARIDLPPGVHAVDIDAGIRGVFSASVDVFDLEVTTLDVRPRPSVAFLGVLGDDQLGRDTVTSAANDVLGTHPGWLWLDRTESAANVLAALGLDSDGLRESESATERIADSRADVADSVAASVYVLAVLDDDLMATRVDVWTWLGPPGPAVVQRLSFSLEGRSFNEELKEAFALDFAKARPYVGAQFVDSAAASHPMVIALHDGGPAAVVLRVGDEIVAIDGTTLRSVADLKETLLASDPGARDFRVWRAGTEMTVQVTVTESAQVVLPGATDVPYGLLWAAAEAHPYLADDPAPDWILRLNQAAVLLHAREWDAAVRHLRASGAPERAGLGQGMVEYWVGLALLRLGGYADLARQSFERAAAIEGATLGHDDGPLIRPLAEALLAGMAQ